LRTQEEIDEQLNLARQENEKGTTLFPGLFFEDGVLEALTWVTGQQNQRPMVDE
jgi:hypothetical protein